MVCQLFREYLLSQRFTEIHSIDQVFPHVLQEIVHFFTIYKELEDKKTEIKGWLGPRETRQAILDSRNRYLKKKKTRAKSK